MRETKSRTSSGPRRFIGGAEISANKTAPSRRTLIVSNFIAIPVLDLMVAAPRRSCKDHLQTAALVFVAKQHDFTAVNCDASSAVFDGPRRSRWRTPHVQALRRQSSDHRRLFALRHAEPHGVAHDPSGD